MLLSAWDMHSMNLLIWNNVKEKKSVYTLFFYNKKYNEIQMEMVFETV